MSCDNFFVKLELERNSTGQKLDQVRRAVTQIPAATVLDQIY